MFAKLRKFLEKVVKKWEGEWISKIPSTVLEMNHFQRLNEVKELKIFFFTQRAKTRKQASNRRLLPCDAMAPTVQNRAGTQCPDRTRQRCAQKTRQRCAQQTSSYITVLIVPDLLGSSWVLVQANWRELVLPSLPTRPHPLFSPILVPRSLKLRVSFPCICSPPVCIIHSVTSLSLATTTCTAEHPFFSTHCYPNTYHPMTHEAPFRLQHTVFPPEGLLLSGQGGCSHRPHQE